MRLRGAIDQQRPGPRPVSVTDNLDDAAIGLLPDDRPAMAMLPL